MFKLSSIIGSALLVGASVSTASAQVITFNDLSPTAGAFTFGSFLNPNTPIHDGCDQAPGAIIGAGVYAGYQFGTALFNQQTTQRGWGCTTAANPYGGTAPGGASGGYAFSYLGAPSLFVDFGSRMSFQNVRLAGVSPAQSSVTVYGYDMSGFLVATSSTLNLTSDFQQFSIAFDDVRALEFRGSSSPSTNEFFAIDDINVSPVPEPSTYALMGAGLLALVGIKRRRRA